MPYGPQRVNRLANCDGIKLLPRGQLCPAQGCDCPGAEAKSWPLLVLEGIGCFSCCLHKKPQIHHKDRLVHEMLQPESRSEHYSSLALWNRSSWGNVSQIDVFIYAEWYFILACWSKSPWLNVRSWFLVTFGRKSFLSRGVFQGWNTLQCSVWV